MSGFFITATDTGVGKSVVTAGLSILLQSRGMRVGVMKPVQSGHLRNDPNGDGMCLKRWTNSSDPIEEIVPYDFSLPLAPSLAAEKEGTQIELTTILYFFYKLLSKHDVILVEGAGGLLTPLGSNLTIADLAKAMELPLVIVARPTLGTVNHTALTFHTAIQWGLKPAGVIINTTSKDEIKTDTSISENAFLIKQATHLPVLGKLPWIQSLTSRSIRETFEQNIDLLPLINMI